MGVKLEKGRFYLMPVVFGPVSSPRADPTGKRPFYNHPEGTEYRYYRVVYETNSAKLENILPDGFSLNGPYVILTFSSLCNIGWLAGKQYEVCSIGIPVHFKGKVDNLIGTFEPVLWENHGDPIMCGREQTGYSKLFGDFEIPTEKGRLVTASLGTWGFKFLEMKMNLGQAPENQEELAGIVQNKNNQGRMYWKYIPHTGEPWAEADANYYTMSPSSWDPPADYDISVLKKPIVEYGKGEVTWHRPRWEDTPGQSHIIQYLADLEIKRYVGGIKQFVWSSNDLRNQRVIQ